LQATALTKATTVKLAASNGKDDSNIMISDGPLTTSGTQQE
jgi:hypothetical protein